MSLRPGIGALFMDEVASQLLRYGLDDFEDVPTELRHGNRTLPLGRYLTRRLRTRIGRSPETPEKKLKEWCFDMQRLYEAATKDDPDGFNRTALFKAAVVLQDKGKANILERRRNHGETFKVQSI